MIRRFIIVFFSLMTGAIFFASGQSISDTAGSRTDLRTDTVNHLRELRFIAGNYSSLEVDALENIYLVNNEGVIKKYSATGDSIGVYNDVKNFGRPGRLSVANPLQLLVYYPTFGSVVILDRFLTERSRLNLRNKNIFSVSGLAAAYDNNIWVFDSQNMQLKKLDTDGNQILATNDFRTFLNPVPQPQVIIDANNLVFLYDAQHGFYVFDRYGTYLKQAKIAGLESVGAFKEYGFGVSGKEFIIYNSTNGNISRLPFNQLALRDLSLVNGKFFGITAAGLYIFKLNAIDVE